MHDCKVVVERCAATRLYVGHVPGIPGAHSQGETPEELRNNLQEALALMLEDGDPAPNRKNAGRNVSGRF